MFANLVANARRDNIRRNAFHAIRLVQLGIDMMQVLVISLYFRDGSLVLGPFLEEDFLVVQQRSCVALRVQRRFCDRILRELLEDVLNPLDWRKDLLHRQILVLRFAVLAGHVYMPSSDPGVEVVHQLENSLIPTVASAK